MQVHLHKSTFKVKKQNKTELQQNLLITLSKLSMPINIFVPF